MEHFGVRVMKRKYELKLVREEYAIISNKNSFGVKFSQDIYTDDTGKFYKDEWCQKHYKECMENYDLNMEYFKRLDKEEFNRHVNRFLKGHKNFKEVTDLKLYDGESGYYIMVLDEYKQLYVGTTDNIKRRIQQHWSKRKPFDRLLLPMGAVNTSIMSIDSFRALDTTRIYASITNSTYKNEDRYINWFKPEFVCNRIFGGILEDGLIQAISTLKNRQLDK